MSGTIRKSGNIESRNIIHVCSSVPYGGIQKLVELLVREQQHNGLCSHVCVCDTWRKNYRKVGAISERIFASADIRFRKIDPLSAKKWVELFKIVSQSELVHMHAPPSWFVIGALAFKRQPWILHLHRYPSKRGDDLKSYLLQYILVKNCNAYIAVSHSVASQWKLAFPQIRKRIFVVQNGIKVKNGNEKTLPVEKRGSMCQLEGPLFAMASRFAANKGLDIFVRAASAIKRKLPESRFVLAGEGPESGSVRQLVQSMELSSCFEFPGFVNDISHFWQNADFALFTSPCEPFGLRILEAQLAGTVVVGFKTGWGSDEVIVNKETGVLLPWEDYEGLAKICKKLWLNRYQYEKMRESASRKLKREFSAEIMMKQVNDVYDNVLCGQYLTYS